MLLHRPWLDDFLLAYSAMDAGSTTYGIGIATSPDGAAWTKDPGSPVFTAWAGSAWFQNTIDPYALRFDGSVYNMYLMGYNAGPPVKYYIGEAYGENGSAWDMNTMFNPLLSPSAIPAWDDTILFANYPFIESGALRMFYLAAGTTSNLALGTATAAPSHNAEGILTSSVFDAGEATDWKSVHWRETKPAGTSVKVEVRCGDTATPGASWTAWAQVTNGGQNPDADSRYMQYRVTLSTANAAVSPELYSIAFNLPIDLTPNKTAFSTSDTLSVTADVEPISTPCYPFVRVLMPNAPTLYYERGKGFTASPTPYLGFSGGPVTVGAAIAGYPVLSAAFSGIPAGTYVLEGGAVDMTRTTSANNLRYVGTVDRERLTAH